MKYFSWLKSIGHIVIEFGFFPNDFSVFQFGILPNWMLGEIRRVTFFSLLTIVLLGFGLHISYSR